MLPRVRPAAALALVVAATLVSAALTTRADDPPKRDDKTVPFREYSIGEVERDAEKVRVAAVWLPPVEMEGACLPAGKWVVHLECDTHALRQNPNGFALGEWLPYMKVHYKIEASGGKLVREGTMSPMVAKDGPHYGATIEMPGAGKYKLTYRLEPPSAGGLERHTDAATGVGAWWKPFDVVYDWDFKGVEGEAKDAAKPIK